MLGGPNAFGIAERSEGAGDLTGQIEEAASVRRIGAGAGPAGPEGAATDVRGGGDRLLEGARAQAVHDDACGVHRARVPGDGGDRLAERAPAQPALEPPAGLHLASLDLEAVEIEGRRRRGEGRVEARAQLTELAHLVDEAPRRLQQTRVG